MIALFVVLAYGVVAVFADRIAPYQAGQVFVEFVSFPRTPSFHGGHLLGTDLLGHDVLSQLLFAVRESMKWSLLTMLGATGSASRSAPSPGTSEGRSTPLWAG